MTRRIPQHSSNPSTDAKIVALHNQFRQEFAMLGGTYLLAFLCAALIIQCTPMLAQLFEYPEDSSDLQKYQDVSRCYPDIGEWYMMYRNFYVDQTFGGSAKCVKYSGAGKYNDYSMPAVIEYHPNESVSHHLTLGSLACYKARNIKILTPTLGNGGSTESNLAPQMFHVIYTDCKKCLVLRHRYANSGTGCSFWRRADSIKKCADCCEFIYDEICGSFPKYKVYDPKKCALLDAALPV
ncbi:hypothetical protein MTO96_031935 [Rhipicephalus appendiculatus]